MRTRLPLLAAALPLIAGCSTTSYSLTATAPAGARSEVRITGERPKITIENKGPDRLHVTLDFAGDADDEVLEIDRVRFTRRGPGPVTILFEPLGDEGATWSARARPATGLTYDVDVEPAPAP